MEEDGENRSLSDICSDVFSLATLCLDYFLIQKHSKITASLLANAAFGRLQAFPTYGGLNVSTPSY